MLKRLLTFPCRVYAYLRSSEAPSGYLRQHWFALSRRACLLALPVLPALYMIQHYAASDSDYLLRFGRPDQLIYAVNGAAVVLVLSSFAVVAMSLVFYGIGVLRDLTELPLQSRLIQFLNGFSIACLSVLWSALIGLILMFIITASGGNVPWQRELHEFIQISRWFAIGVFVTFLLVDVCLLISQIEQIHLLRQRKVTSWEQLILHKRNGIEFGVLSIALINIPMLMLSGLAEWLNRQLHSNHAYHVFFDFDRRFSQIFPAAANDTLQLFANGLDAGIVGATILLSQIAFFVLQTRWHYRQFLLNKGDALRGPGQTPNGEPAGAAVH